MSVIQRTIHTKATAAEMKTYINQHLLTRKDLSVLLNSSIWVGNTLNVDSKLGDGTIVLKDYQIDVTLNLSFFGNVAKKQLESGLDDVFKQLPPK